jgi:hypothetical protein
LRRVTREEKLLRESAAGRWPDHRLGVRIK